MTTIPIPGRVSDDGQHVRLLSEDEYWRQVKALAGEEIEIVIRKRRKQRSLQANALYWSAYVGPIAEWTGYTPLETHELLKRLFLPEAEVKHMVVCDMHGEVIAEDHVPIDLSTTRLDTKEFSAYLDAISKWAGEKLGIEIHGERLEAAS